MFNLSDSGYVFHFQVDGDKVLVEGLPENWDNFANTVTFFADIVTFWENVSLHQFDLLPKSMKL